MKRELCKLEDYDKILSILNKISIFGGLTRPQLAIIFKHLKKVDVVQGEIIFKQGDSPDNIYILQKGLVKVIEESSGKSLELAMLSTGDCLGETELIGIFPYIATAIALEDTSLVAFTRKALRILYKEHPQIFTIIILNIARESCRRLAEADKRAINLLKN